MKKFYFRVIAIGMIVLPFCAKAQVTEDSNAPTAPNPYVGLAVSENYALQIRHNGNHPINVVTDSILRMKLNETVNYAVNNGASLSRNGYLLIGQNSPIATQNNASIYNTGVFSLLHLNGYGTSETHLTSLKKSSGEIFRYLQILSSVVIEKSLSALSILPILIPVS